MSYAQFEKLKKQWAKQAELPGEFSAQLFPSWESAWFGFSTRSIWNSNDWRIQVLCSSSSKLFKHRWKSIQTCMHSKKRSDELPAQPVKDSGSQSPLSSEAAPNLAEDDLRHLK